jgi:hypothetical protein
MGSRSYVLIHVSTDGTDNRRGKSEFHLVVATPFLVALHLPSHHTKNADTGTL